MLGQLILGKYRVNRLLDEGGMSKIYLAHQAEPARDVVVKVLKDALRAQPKTLEHFRRRPEAGKRGRLRLRKQRGREASFAPSLVSSGKH